MTIKATWGWCGFRNLGPLPADGPNRGKFFRFRIRLGFVELRGYDPLPPLEHTKA